MSLTLDDLRRLEAAGERGFFRERADGTLRLVNVAGRCVFLDDGRCRVYPHRPEGCVLYPLVWCDATSEPDLHDFCPHAGEFRFSSGDVAWLARSIATEAREITARLSQRSEPAAKLEVPNRSGQ